MNNPLIMRNLVILSNGFSMKDGDSKWQNHEQQCELPDVV